MSAQHKSASVKDLQDAWKMVFQQGAMLAMMPIEEWLAAFDRAEATCPILDPTLYRDSRNKAEVIKAVLGGALKFKRAIQQAQSEIIKNPEIYR